MNLSKLTPAKGSVRDNKRVGRGQGSGRGGTSTRGHKGAGSRSGHKMKIGFEGGQMPLIRQIPKFGFKNPNRIEYKVINLEVLDRLINELKVEEINFDTLKTASLVSKNDKVKILGNGSLSKKVNVYAHAFSKNAKEAIEKIGGKAIIIEK